ncbi:hypothetical protein CDL12_16059 [Handroanthus impetiginosus]|uniref:Uncharacterized protein n=1 Tax=Handroanthus impetiginosus TaxID=429701 RepID=A0A2G9H1D8_9LAMI|nr:hypothetical protein CDL12_16059 [Handroanthus impetiginosus]
MQNSNIKELKYQKHINTFLQKYDTGTMSLILPLSILSIDDIHFFITEIPLRIYNHLHIDENFNQKVFPKTWQAVRGGSFNNVKINFSPYTNINKVVMEKQHYCK